MIKGTSEVKSGYSWTGNSYITVKEATTKNDGVYKRKCEECKGVHQRVIPKISVVKMSSNELTYNGEKRYPKFIIKDSKGKALKKNKDYTVTAPKGRTEVGKYTFTIKFKNSYEGTKKLTLTIKPTKPVIVKPSAAKRNITVKWKKATKQKSGYQVKISKDEGFKKNTGTYLVKSNKATTKKIAKLKRKTTYYVKVRAYKTIKRNGKYEKIYSSWSEVKSIKTR